MKTPLPLVVALLASALLVPALADAPAPASAPLHVVVGKPLTRMTDVLANLSQQSGVPILADNTVVDTLGVTTLDKPDLDSVLTVLASLGQGMSWQRVYLPKDVPLPDADSLSAQVRTLREIKASGLLIEAPNVEAISYTKSSPATKTSVPDDMRLVYLVTNETVRAQRLAAQKTSEAKKVAAQAAPVDNAVEGMQSAADDLGKMTPDQQRQAIPLMFQQMMRMLQNIDPGVRDEMRQQWQQRRNAGQGGGTAPGQ